MNIIAICPSCGEAVGLVNDEELITHTLTAGDTFASFVCHTCQSGWRIRAVYEPFKTVDDE